MTLADWLLPRNSPIKPEANGLSFTCDCHQLAVTENLLKTGQCDTVTHRAMVVLFFYGEILRVQSDLRVSL